MNDQAIEQEIQAKGKTAARIKPEDIEANIVSEHYFTAAQGVAGAHALKWLDAGERVTTSIRPNANDPLHLLTFCVLVLKNGFTVTGESACASPENFDADLGRKIARQNAVQKIWPLMGYALKEQLAAEARGALEYGQRDAGLGGGAMTLQPWQERVVEEKEQLAERLEKLNAFFVSQACLSLPFEERCLLARQALTMTQYLDILLDRIARFFETATTKGA